MNLKGSKICLLNKPSTCIQLRNCLRNIVPKIGKLGFYDKEAGWCMLLEDLKEWSFPNAS